MAAIAPDRTATRRARSGTGRRQHDAHLRLVIDTIPAMVWSLEPDGALDFVNQRWLEFTGLSLAEALAKPNNIVHPEDLPRVIETWLMNQAARMAFEDEMRLRRADGAYRWFLVRTVPLADAKGNISKWYGTAADIEDRKRADEALRNAATQLQSLSRHLVNLQEAERKELARELHDRVGQSLTALNINLEIIRQGLPPGDAGLKSRLEDSAALVESSMHAIGNVLSDLRPQLLDDHGLRAALEWYASQFSARLGIRVSVLAGALEERLAADREIVLFRIAQEALNNVARHASAARVEIVIERREHDYVMSVTDDGVGLGAAAGTIGWNLPGLGMLTMRERAQAVGGEVRIESLPERGTRLTVRVPQ